MKKKNRKPKPVYFLIILILPNFYLKFHLPSIKDCGLCVLSPMLNWGVGEGKDTLSFQEGADSKVTDSCASGLYGKTGLVLSHSCLNPGFHNGNSRRADSVDVALWRVLCLAELEVELESEAV